MNLKSPEIPEPEETDSPEDSAIKLERDFELIDNWGNTITFKDGQPVKTTPPRVKDPKPKNP